MSAAAFQHVSSDSDWLRPLCSGALMIAEQRYRAERRKGSLLQQDRQNAQRPLGCYSAL